jgi:iron complex outermembrane receptor protein
MLVVATAAQAQSPEDLSKLSLEELAGVQVTSVSKSAQPLGEAPSAIYVITSQDIARSGAITVPEILRLAPNLHVAQAGASRYVITARGFDGAPAAQNFSNKLLVLIDGRTAYSPLYSGVYWDMQDVLSGDIERIEVISGPGATLWGANAVNGVINIITKGAGETAGGLISASAGSQELAAAVRYGGRISPELSYRLYAKTFRFRSSRTAADTSAHDYWQKPQAGFRLDWTPSAADLVTLQGDIYDGFNAQAGGPAEEIAGHNLTARWSRTFGGGSQLQAQAFYDRVRRGAPSNGAGFWVDTYDLDVQHAMSLGAHQLVWGGGYRRVRYRIAGTNTLFFVPAARSLDLWNGFAQGVIAAAPNLQLTLGAKVEDSGFEGAQLLPSARFAWTPSDEFTIWGAASRAIRSPTPFDRDVVERLGGMIFLVGGGDFVSEKFIAYELGAKLRPHRRLSVSVSGFYNDYDDLRSIEITPLTLLPLRWGNRMKGHAYGLEAWGTFEASSWWRLSGSVSWLDQQFRFKPGASGLLGPSQAGNDPKYRASLSSSIDLSPAVTLDTTFRYVSAFPEPRIRAYAELDARLGWRVSDDVSVALVGRNLLHDDHLEYTDGTRIPRSVFVDLQWRF